MEQPASLILASGSPRRKELLERLDLPFRVIVSDAEEVSSGNASPAEIAQQNALAKARAVACAQDDDSTVIGADTIVVLENRIYGKPTDEDDAKRMLRELSGKTHQVITGVCIIRKGDATTFAETTDVTFKALAEDEISAYVATGEPLDKAGAYGIQGLGGKLVASLAGDYDNVVGLPVARLRGALDL